jgi:hypothetical protein
MSWALVMVVFGNVSFTRSSHVPPKPLVETAIPGLEENKGLSARDVAVNSLDPLKPRIAVVENSANTAAMGAAASTPKAVRRDSMPIVVDRW